MKKTLGYILGAVVVFGMIGACNDDSAVETVEETPVEEVEEVIEETVEVEPVDAEPVEPVVEEEPVNNELMAYSSDISTYMTDFSNVMGDFSMLMTEAGNNPNVMFDDNWTIDVATQLVLMQEIINNVNSLTAPTGYEEIHNLTIKAMNEYQFVVDNFPVAIDNMDVDLINECNDAIVNGSSYIREATTLLAEKNI